jgi:hypothetical protein
VLAFETLDLENSGSILRQPIPSPLSPLFLFSPTDPFSLSPSLSLSSKGFLTKETIQRTLGQQMSEEEVLEMVRVFLSSLSLSLMRIFLPLT